MPTACNAAQVLRMRNTLCIPVELANQPWSKGTGKLGGGGGEPATGGYRESIAIRSRSRPRAQSGKVSPDYRFSEKGFPSTKHREGKRSCFHARIRRRKHYSASHSFRGRDRFRARPWLMWTWLRSTEEKRSYPSRQEEGKRSYVVETDEAKREMYFRVRAYYYMVVAGDNTLTFGKFSPEVKQKCGNFLPSRHVTLTSTSTQTSAASSSWQSGSGVRKRSSTLEPRRVRRRSKNTGTTGNISKSGK